MGAKYIESHGLAYTARPVCLQDVYESIYSERQADGNLPPYDVDDETVPQN